MSYAKRNANILDRIDRHAAHPSTAALRKAAEACFTIAEKFAKHRDSLERDGFLTPAGKRAKLTEALTKQFARDMRDARAPIEAAAKDIELLRGNIKPVQVDRTDVVAAMERAEIRAFIRSLPSADKIAALLNHADPKILDAVLDAPAALSGVPEQHYAAAKEAREEQLFGPQLKEIEALQAVVDEASAAATIARGDLRSVTALDEREFESLVGPIENKKAAPWLVKRGDRIIRVRPERVGTGELNMPATEDEIRDGKFYANEAEYLADRAA
jgi:hypothetical protein